MCYDLILFYIPSLEGGWGKCYLRYSVTLNVRYSVTLEFVFNTKECPVQIKSSLLRQKWYTYCWSFTVCFYVIFRKIYVWWPACVYSRACTKLLVNLPERIHVIDVFGFEGPQWFETNLVGHVSVCLCSQALDLHFSSLFIR